MNAIRASGGSAISRAHIVRALFVMLVAVALTAGGVLRFYAIGEHGFWGDENITALHVAGNTGRDVVNAASAVPISAEAMNRFSQIGAHSSAFAVVKALRTEDSQHPPVYYVLANAWSRAAGSGPVQLRVFSALLSLLLMPSMYWFAVELFGSRRIALIAAALVSVSPFCIEYAQQAREYALWAVLACAACAALLRALKNGRRVWWTLYGASIAIGLYTHIFTLLILFAHILYVAGVRRTISRGSLIGFCVSAGAALLVFVPWGLLLAYAYVHHVSYGGVGFGKTTTSNAFHAGLYPWTVGMTSPFVDLEFVNARYFAVVALAALLEAAAVIALVRRSAFTQWWLPVCLLASAAMLEVKAVLVEMPRYFVPAILAVQMAVAFLIGTARPRMAAAAIGLFAAIIAFDIGDAAVRASMPIWWTNTYGEPLPAIAKRVDASSERAIVLGVAPREWEVLFDVSRFLDPRDLVSFRSPASILTSEDARTRRIFILTRIASLLPPVPAGYVLRPIAVPISSHGYDAIEKARGVPVKTESTWLWQIVRCRKGGPDCS